MQSAQIFLRALLLSLILLALGCGAPAQPPAAPENPVLVLMVMGQSNAIGADTEEAPAGLPDASIQFWRNDYHYNDGAHAFGPLDVAPRGTFSHEIRLAQRLKAAGHDVVVIKIAQGGTYINRWIPTAKMPAAGAKLYGEVTEAISALRVARPGVPLRFLWVWDQGESEARYKDQPTVERWSDNFFEIQRGMEQVVGEPLEPFVVRTCSTITGKTYPGLLESEQASVATPTHLIDSNDSEFRPDNVHRIGRSQNKLGDRIADVVLNEAL